MITSPGLLAVSIIGFQLTMTSVTVGFVKRESSLRSLAFLLMTMLASVQVLQSSTIEHPVCRTVSGAASAFLVVLYLDVALLSRWTFQAKGPTSSVGGLTAVKTSRQKQDVADGRLFSETTARSSRIDALKFGLKVAVSSRFPATKWQVKGTPPFSRTDPARIPGRTKFLARNLSKCALFIVILRSVSGLGDPNDNAFLFASRRIPLFARRQSISTQELTTRVLGVAGYWTIQYLCIDVMYNVPATTAVMFNLTHVEEWPPVFGFVGDSWSIRRFWGQVFLLLLPSGHSS